MGLAQQIAFSSLLAFFPAVVFLVGLLDLVDAYPTLEGVPRSDRAGRRPGDGRHAAGGDVDGTSTLAFVIGLAGATWAASGAMNSVLKAVNRAYERVETRPFWMTRIISIVLVFLTGLTTAGLLLLIVFGGPLGNAIAEQARLGGAFDLVWSVLRWPIAFAAILLFFSFVYYLAPNLDVRNWRWLSPGALLGGLSWLALSGLFALYTSFSESYSRTYGALASGVVLLLWLNYSAFALLFGAELNSELDREAEIYAAGGPDAGLVKPSRRVSRQDHDHQAAELRRAPVRVEDERAALQREPPDNRGNLGHARLPIDTRAAQVEVVQLRPIAHGDHVRPSLELPRPRAGDGAQRDRGAGTDGRVQPDRRSGVAVAVAVGRYRRRSRRAS